MIESTDDVTDTSGACNDLSIVSDTGTGIAAPASKTIVACHDCDLLNRVEKAAMATQVCARCGSVLRRYRPNSIERSLAFVFAGLILFLISNTFPFLAIKSGAFIQKTTLLTGIHELWNQGEQGLSLLVLLTCVLIPLVQITGLLYIMTPLRFFTRPAPHAIHVLRLLTHVAPWGMMEIFMVGILVALVKLGKMATIILGTSAFSLAALIVVMAAAVTCLDQHLLWEQLDVNP
ncbi:MAG: paraquat-inducible protein A [Pseudomonadota bacterium]